MKRKFLILTLCFTLIFSSINYKKSYADGGVISLPILATVGSLAVASGIVIKNDDDLYDIGRMFYDYVKSSNDLTWDIVKATFNSSVAVLNNGLVSVDSKFLDIVKGFFDYSISTSQENTIFSSYFDDGKLAYFIDTVDFTDVPKESGKYKLIPFEGGDIYIGHYNPIKGDISASYLSFSVLFSDGSFGRKEIGGDASTYKGIFTGLYYIGNNQYKITYISRGTNKSTSFSVSGLSSIPSILYEGGYTWDNVESKKENDSIALPIPGNLGQLVGQGSADFWDNTDGLVGTGGITVPGVDSPSIGFDDVISFPSVDVPDVDAPDVDAPVDTPFANITEYIIGLVVPSDSYWTDTFGGLYNNFTSSFPLVDMGNFNNLVTGEKKFPNIDVNIMGVKGRIVNGDIVNSIVDWLRPIIAGFMMLCLMLFNYRKIYKTIRGVEPFQGIAQGSSDFRTGISEYNYMGTGLSKSDYEANQMELAKALHDYEQDTGKTYKIKI